MGSRDYKQREQKKQKKDTKKAISLSLPTPSAEVPVLRKRKAREEAP